MVAVLQERADPFQELVDQVRHLDRIENGTSLNRAGRINASHSPYRRIHAALLREAPRTPPAAAPACYAAAEAECGPGICGFGDANDLSEDADGAQRGLLANVRIGRAEQLLDLGRKVTRQLGAMDNRRLRSYWSTVTSIIAAHSHPRRALNCAALRCVAMRSSSTWRNYPE